MAPATSRRPGIGVGRHPAPVWRFTDRADGDLSITAENVEARRRAVVDLPWTWLRQAHGSDVMVVRRPGEHAGRTADAAVTAVPGAALAVQVADCAPVALLGPAGVGAVHAGWRGVVAGVVGAAIEHMRLLGSGAVRAVVGPCIRPCCYEFGADELDMVATALGDGVRARTTDGRPALDLPGAVQRSLAAAGVVEVVDEGVCTACSPRHWSHRARGDRRRQALVAWLE
ncbi:MAG TPA: laccase domain-containing protein [Acidimicrobiales bacterium]|nr:laccase domain-containing protein [Acidimicrobiales bacterium]